MKKIVIHKVQKDNRVGCRLDDTALAIFIELQNKWLCNPAEVIRRCIVETYKCYKDKP